MNEQTIKMFRGRTESFILDVKDVDGSAYALADGEILRFGVKLSTISESYVLLKDLTNADADGDGYRLCLDPEDTAGLSLGRYVYDVGLLSGENYITIIPTSYFELLGNVTGKEV